MQSSQCNGECRFLFKIIIIYCALNLYITYTERNRYKKAFNLFYLKLPERKFHNTV